jgi:chromosome segregation ATPase
MLSSKQQSAEELEGQKSRSDQAVVDLEARLTLLEEERAQAREQAENLRQELLSVNQELKKKVNQLTQVTNMKKMIQDKNTKIRGLMGRLAKYESVEEPDDPSNND